MGRSGAHRLRRIRSPRPRRGRYHSGVAPVVGARLDGGDRLRTVRHVGIGHADRAVVVPLRPLLQSVPGLGPPRRRRRSGRGGARRRRGAGGRPFHCAHQDAGTVAGSGRFRSAVRDRVVRPAMAGLATVSGRPGGADPGRGRAPGVRGRRGCRPRGIPPRSKARGVTPCRRRHRRFVGIRQFVRMAGVCSAVRVLGVAIRQFTPDLGVATRLCWRDRPVRHRRPVVANDLGRQGDTRGQWL